MQNLEAKLRLIGLSPNEIKAYLALVTHGGLTALELSERTGIPSSKIYNVLKKLRERNWIIVKQGRPSLYYPVPPIEAWESTRKKIISELDEVENTVIAEIQHLYETTAVEREFMLGSLYIVYGLETIIDSIIEILEKKCRGSIMVAMPFEAILNNEKLVEKIKWLSQNWDLKLLISNQLQNLIYKKFRDARMSVRTRDKLFGGGVICDEVIFIVENRDLFIGLRSGLDFFVNLAKIYFEYLWKDGEILLLS
ncbi:MAG: hypothetical protein B6U95_00605 [Thermofilum sp. ex4484_82]|nr:MAG: hypothetical protein B6U95_00605 [Thermofilum sp. ex4484_82]OYT39909.1 MAG: hypothetical protein B6U96_00610 [Archaeoglobales archaeon ex4484_92]RLE73586.1 MAG: hypothetical protein DRZ80_06075 [Thermoprotei archaeon]RLE75241.1 MAG: hypothetical protein DRJ44_06165 [Thermoprotei archaeon]